jgi:hypothetical protein
MLNPMDLTNRSANQMIASESHPSGLADSTQSVKKTGHLERFRRIN